MSDPISLESILQNRAATEACKACAFLSNYVAMKNYLTRDYYPWIQANCQWYTDHGSKHVDSVMHTTSHLLSNAPQDGLNCLDVYLLLTSIIWHDVGLLAGRADHARETEVFINKVREICFPDPTIHRLVCQIVRAHSGHEGWSFLQQSEPISPCTHKSCIVYPQSLAAILRFADEASETRTRISASLLERVPPEQKIYWEYAHSVTASTPEPARRRLLLAIELQRADAVKRLPCPKHLRDRADGDGNIAVIQYVVCRIEKLNNERAYCFPYLTRYADIRTIDVRLQVCDGTESAICLDFTLGDGGMTGCDYPDIEMYSRFFDIYPQLIPAKLVGGS